MIVLTDWDGRGEEVAKAAESYLASNGAKPDLRPRKRLRILTNRDVKDVEGLRGYVERLRRECADKPQNY